MQAKLEAKEQEAKETYDRLLRVSADFENYKKRSAREIEEFRKYANQTLLKEMLSVVDNLELAINSSNHGKKTDNNLIEGLNPRRSMKFCGYLKGLMSNPYRRKAKHLIPHSMKPSCAKKPTIFRKTPW